MTQNERKIVCTHNNTKYCGTISSGAFILAFGSSVFFFYDSSSLGSTRSHECVRVCVGESRRMSSSRARVCLCMLFAFGCVCH